MSDEPKTIRPATGLGTPDETLSDICGALFGGKLAWLAWMGCIYGTVFLGLAIFAAVMFFRVDSIRSMIAYATLFGLSSVFMAVTEMWFWAMGFRKSIAIRLDRLEGRLDQRAEPAPVEHPEATGHAA